MTLRYTTVRDFWKFMFINESILDFQAGDSPLRETIKATPVSAGVYYLDQLGVNEDTLILYIGSSNTALTLTTDYTFDSDTSAITLTSDGATALSGEDLTAVYEYNSQGKYLSYNETVSLLESSEQKIHGRCNTYFADQSSSTPGYLQVENEMLSGQGGINSIYSLQKGSIIKLQTTTNGAYTTGGTEITLTDASGFPASGTIYIDGNKVSYISISGNTLTIPDSTPSITDGAVARGEVIEASTSPDGVVPTYSVLIPGSDYEIDYDTGDIQILNAYYSGDDTSLSSPQDGIKNRVRATYNQAWHELGRDARIDEEIPTLVHMIAGRQIIQRTILKSYAGQRDNFNPTSFGFSKLDIDEIVNRYKVYKFRSA